MEKLQKSFKKLLTLETEARDIYSDILLGLTNNDLIEKITFIKNQEIGHMKLVKILIKMGELAEKRKKEPRISEKDLAYLNNDFLFKRQLLNTINELLNTKIQTFTLLNLLGAKSLKFEKTEKLYQNLINIAAHQLKTPLTVTRWISESLLKKRKGKLTINQEEMIKEVKKANESMFFLVDDLLTLNKIKEGPKRIEPEKVDLVKLFQEALKEVDYLIKSKKQKISFQPFENSILFLSDKAALEKIISNLLTNAINYGRQGGVISIKIEKEGAKKILISVADDGIGIPLKEQKDIFKEFFRASNAQKIHPKGTGLGLYLVKELVKKLKGKIWFKSKENKGTAFYLSFLPRER